MIVHQHLVAPSLVKCDSRQLSYSMKVPRNEEAYFQDIFLNFQMENVAYDDIEYQRTTILDNVSIRVTIKWVMSCH